MAKGHRLDGSFPSLGTSVHVGHRVHSPPKASQPLACMLASTHTTAFHWGWRAQLRVTGPALLTKILHCQGPVLFGMPNPLPLRCIQSWGVGGDPLKPQSPCGSDIRACHMWSTIPPLGLPGTVYGANGWGMHGSDPGGAVLPAAPVLGREMPGQHHSQEPRPATHVAVH